MIRFLFLFVFSSLLSAQTLNELTIEKIMRDPMWIGTSPENVFWSEDGNSLYFDWNPENEDEASLYKITVENLTPQKVNDEEEESLPARRGVYNRSKTKKIYSDDGDIFIYDIPSMNKTQITSTPSRESNPTFGKNDSEIIFRSDNNIFMLDLNSAKLTQLTNFISGSEKKEKKKTEQEKFVEERQLELIKVLAERKEKSEKKEKESKSPKPVYLDKSSLRDFSISDDGKFLAFSLMEYPSNVNRTIIPDYVTESGYTETSNAYAKVGGPQTVTKFGILNIESDSLYYVVPDSLPGIFSKPEYLLEYQTDKSDSLFKEPKDVVINGPVWAENSNRAIVVIRSLDNKDRWIALLDPKTGKLKCLDWQHDEAWIGGPGISSSNWSTGTIGFLPDEDFIYFQSEESGYSHLYLMNLPEREIIQLTDGDFEVYNPKLSMDKAYWYFTANIEHPGIRHFYKMPIFGGGIEKLTTKTGRNDCTLSPNEKHIAVIHSYKNQPPELYLKENLPATAEIKITNSVSNEFASYNWYDPEVISFEADDGENVTVRLYLPQEEIKNNAAVIFVHGAGYLQNAHYWWSHYSREYMFHNLLRDKGFTVLDIDYRGSAGYGRDWRTGIYRHMGGLDLSDQVDGAEYLIADHGIDKNKIGIYGGSYGGFITLMAMFKHPGVFAAGAALRSVTDWAHYHHGYTANILNTPQTDSLAYVRSSPIYFAEGLTGKLLMCHGMVDDNVHFQDIVRVTQRLIELEKDNWELAVYPVEKHSFTEPSSWIDEYKRILRLFEMHLSEGN